MDLLLHFSQKLSLLCSHLYQAFGIYHKLLCGGGGVVVKLCLTLATSWTVACQAPLSMGFSKQGYWSGLPFSSPEEFPQHKNKIIV